MLIYDKKLDSDYTFFGIPNVSKEKVLYFDIETTGFSPATSILYLIGCVYCDDEGFKFRQWFCDTPESEPDIISDFLDFVKSFSVIVHYNGSGFDIPFIIKKCDIHHIPCDFSGIESFDIYKNISMLKSLLKLENLKQKSIESFMSVPRDDKYSGGELIKVYEEYLKSADDSLLKLLLLHNHDDVMGMVKILPVINYNCLNSGGYEIVSADVCDSVTPVGGIRKEVIIELALDSFLPKRISGGNNNFYFTACGNLAKISINIYTGELKYFYPDYKNYYYLPGEDRSIHKSVAFYVDKDFRTKAKAANCYSKKSGIFLPQYEEIINPYFKIDYYDKITYFECSQDFLADKNLVKKYCESLFRKI